MKTASRMMEATAMHQLPNHLAGPQATLDDVLLRILPSIAPLLTSGIQFFATVFKRLKWADDAVSGVGDLGWSFRAADVYPNRASGCILIAIMLAAVVALVHAAAWLTSGFYVSWFSDFLFLNSLWILVIWLVAATVVHLNIPSRIMLFLVGRNPEARYSPGWVNALWHVNAEEKAIPVNIEMRSCESIANDLARAFLAHVDFSADRALLPNGLSEDERANVLLIGCVIEQKIAGLHLDRTNLPSWGAFYTALAQAGLRTERPFSPGAINTFRDQPRSFYKHLAAIFQPPDALLQEPAVDLAVERTISRLIAVYGGSARGLAFSSDAGTPPNITTARKNVASFDGLDSYDDEMRTQFLKLAVGHEVWPGIDPGPFVYPFNAHVAAMLFNKKCLITVPDEPTLNLVEDTNMRHLVASAEQLISETVQNYLVSSTASDGDSYFDSTFGYQPTQVPLWKTCYVVDYVLWHLAHNLDNAQSALGWQIDDWEWHVQDRSLVR